MEAPGSALTNLSRLALEAFEQDTVLLAALGKPLAKTHLAVRRAELAAMEGMTLEVEVELLRDRY